VGEEAGLVVQEHDISVVLPVRNAAAVIGQQLAALSRQRWDGSWEVVVSDNGSTDGTRDVVEQYRERLPHLRVVDSSDRRGPGHARNVGAAAACGTSLLFCDADDEVGDGWLAAMATALSTHHFVAATLDRAKLNPDWVQPARPRSGLLDTSPPFLPYAFTAALGVKRALHLAVGGFDEEFAVSCEDRDYCYRIQLAGTPLHLAPGAVVHYRLRCTFADIYRNARDYAAGNVLLFVRYRAQGLRRPSPLRSLGSWLALVPRLPFAFRRRQELAQWCVRLGWLVGRARGSLTHRVLYL
jgi:glycosyltransferase involved in cell wall biosynthesis